MERDFDIDSGTTELKASYSRTVKIPEGASMAQIKAFHAIVDSVQMTPHNHIMDAYEKAFEEILEDDVTPSELNTQEEPDPNE